MWVKCSQSYKAPCTVLCVSFNFSFLSLPFNPVTSAPRAGEVSQRLSHGLRANPTPRALPEGRPSVHSVWSVLRGKASAAWPNSTFQHTPPSWRKAQSIHSTRHTRTRAHRHAHTACAQTQTNQQINRQMWLLTFDWFAIQNRHTHVVLK